MSVEIIKYDKYGVNIISSVGVSSERMYYQYLEPAVKELKISYFRNEGMIKKCNLNTVMGEIELLIDWVKHNVEKDDMEYLQEKLLFAKKYILEALKEEDDILYIF